MHEITPYYRWLQYYDSSKDQNSPFYQMEYNYQMYSTTIYGYYIDPSWDFIGSETLYIKILYVNYDQHQAIIEIIGEWNDAIHNDIMHFKRNIIDELTKNGIQKFLLIGENVFNFHGSDDCYYEEWFDEIDEGWIVCLGFQEHVKDEWSQYQIDHYFQLGYDDFSEKWRTLKPQILMHLIEEKMKKSIPGFL